MSNIVLETKEMGESEVENILGGDVSNRPLTLITTRSREDNLNLTLASSYQFVSINPPIISLPFSDELTDSNETLNDILLSNQFVVHLPSEIELGILRRHFDGKTMDLKQARNFGFSAVESRTVEPQGLERFPVRLECNLYDQHSMSRGSINILYGSISCIHLDEAFYSGQRLNLNCTGSASRSGRPKVKGTQDSPSTAVGHYVRQSLLIEC